MSISIICLTYKRVHLLEEAIFSVINQTYKDWELIIVNDCEEQELIYDHPQIKIFNVKEKFKTIGAKRNFALKQCTKDYIVSLDDDDLFLSRYLDILHKTVDKYDALASQRSWFYDNDKNIRLSDRSMSSIFIFNREKYKNVKYPEKNFDEVGSFFMNIMKSSGNGLLKELNPSEIGYVYRRKVDSQYSMFNMNVMDFNIQDSILQKIPVNQIGKIQLNPHWNKDYDTIIKISGDYTIRRLSSTDTSKSIPKPTREQLIQQEAIGGWNKVKSSWDKASSFLQTIQSRGIVSTTINIIGVDNTFGQKVSNEIYNKRRMSCFGNGKNISECEVLKRDTEGIAFCGSCGCGANKLAMLEGDGYNKLYYPYLECPLKKPGFSNEPKPQYIITPGEIPISIIIPVLNDNEELNLTIQSIYETSPENVEIIVIDDASNVPAIVSDKRVKLFRFSERKGAGQARHFGAQNASSKHLLFIDSHMRFDSQWFNNAITRIKSTPKTLWCGACLGLDDSNMNVNNPIGVYTGADLVLYADKNKTIFDGIWKPDITSQDDYQISCVMGACYFIHKDWYFYIKGLGQTMMWGSEEPILSTKTWLAGGEVRLMKSVRLGHKFRSSSPYSTTISHIHYNKLAYMYMILPTDIFEKIKVKFNQDGDFKAAMNLVNKNIKLLDEEKKYYENIFKYDIYWVCDKFKIEMPN